MKFCFAFVFTQVLVLFLDPIGSLDFTLLTIGNNQFVNSVLEYLNT